MEKPKVPESTIATVSSKGKQLKITIPGKPIAKARPRFFKRGKHVQTYNSQETEEGKWMQIALSQIDGELLSGPLCLDIEFVMPRPKYHFGTGQNANILKRSAPYWHTKKPDIDNLIKFAMDCLNNIAWSDDKCIAKVDAIKRYTLIDEEPCTVIVITSNEFEVDIREVGK